MGIFEFTLHENQLQYFSYSNFEMIHMTESYIWELKNW